MPYLAVATAILNGSVTDADIVGATITLNTLTAAVYTAEAVFDVDLTGATTTLTRGKLVIDGVTQTAEGNFQQGVATDRGTTPQIYRGAVSGAGSHTFKLTATIPASASIRDIHTNLIVVIYEIV